MSITDKIERAETKAKVLALISYGAITPREAADLAGLNRVTVFLWLRDAGINHREARARFVAKQWERALAEKKPRPINRKATARKIAREAYKQYAASSQRPTKGETVFTSQDRAMHDPNPHKARVLAQLRAGKIGVKRAATLAGVPISGIVGWCKLENIPLPEQYLQPRRPRPEP